MKSRGEMLYAAVIAAGAFGRGWDALDDEVRGCYEQAAAEYDKARAQLPDDVEAFVATWERALEGMEHVDGFRRLIAIVREQWAELAVRRVRDSRQESEDLSFHADYIRRINAAEAERDALCDRLATLDSSLASEVTERHVVQGQLRQSQQELADIRHEARRTLEWLGPEYYCDGRPAETLAKMVDMKGGGNG
jgi:predicted  nucleic acid-binding Zn-ribbon protein